MNSNKYENDDCVNFYSSIKVTIEVFQGFYDKFLKLSSEEYDEDEVGEDLKNLQSQISLICLDINKKCENLENILKECKGHRKSKLKEEFKNKRKNFEKVYQTYLKKVEENQNKIEGSSPFSYNPTPSNNYTSNNNNNNNNNNYNPYYENEQGMPEYECNEQNIKIVENIMEDDSNFIGCSEEELQQIMDLKNQLRELMNVMNEKIDEADMQLDEIESNIVHSHTQISKGNEELRKAAYDHIKSHRIKYSLIFGGILGAIGSIVPGIGNAIGAAIGGAIGGAVGVGIGQGLSKMEKKAVDRIGKKKEKKDKK